MIEKDNQHQPLASIQVNTPVHMYILHINTQKHTLFFSRSHFDIQISSEKLNQYVFMNNTV